MHFFSIEENMDINRPEMMITGLASGKINIIMRLNSY